jgi:hypothetical protein
LRTVSTSFLSKVDGLMLLGKGLGWQAVFIVRVLVIIIGKLF